VEFFWYWQSALLSYLLITTVPIANQSQRPNPNVYPEIRIAVCLVIPHVVLPEIQRVARLAILCVARPAILRVVHQEILSAVRLAIQHVKKYPPHRPCPLSVLPWSWISVVDFAAASRSPGTRFLLCLAEDQPKIRAIERGSGNVLLTAS
jgi:hypothetical protein